MTYSTVQYSGVICLVIPFILDVRLLDVPAGVTQLEKGHTGFLRLPSIIPQYTGKRKEKRDISQDTQQYKERKKDTDDSFSLELLLVK